MSAMACVRIRSGPYNSRFGSIPALILGIVLGCALPQLGCSRNYEAETTLLERAEANFTAGDYDVAEQLYRQFLRRHPRSPYADIAGQRLRILDRELEAVMGQRGTLTPVHIKQLLPPDMERGTTSDTTKHKASR